MKDVLNNNDLPVNVHELPDNIAERISIEEVFGSAGRRECVRLDDKLVTVLHRIEPKEEKGTGIAIDPRDGKKRRVKYKRLVGGRWQFDIDRKDGNDRLFDSREHAINMALAIGLRDNEEPKSTSNICSARKTKRKTIKKKR